MTKIGKRLAAVLLAVAMVVTFMPVLGTQTAYAEGEIPITSITLAASSDFTVPEAGEPITYPDNILVKISDPSGIENSFQISYSWYDNITGTNYYQSSGKTGTFTPGDWDLGVIISRPSDGYAFDSTRFDYGTDLFEIDLCGKTLYATSVSSSNIIYTTTFTVGVGIPEGKTLIYNGEDQVGVDNGLYYDVIGNTATDAGEYTATVSLKDKTNLTWSDGTKDDKSITWEIKKAPITSVVAEDQLYNGLALEPDPIVKSYDAILSKDLDYSVSYYSDNTNVGTARVVVVGNNNYFGNVEGYFEIIPASIKQSSVTVTGIAAKAYTGKAITQTPVVKDEDTTLKAGTDYTVSYKNNTNVGTATVTITGKGNYTGTIEKTFKITAKKITPTVTLSASAYTWNGKVKKPTVTVKDGSTKLAASQYTVTYASGRKNVGKYNVKVALKGNYSGSKTVTFKINPKGTSIKTLTKASKAVTVKWTKQATKMSSSRITGYQIQLATDSKFTKNKKTVTVKGYSNVSKKVTGLKGSKKYYVRIRTYKTVSGTNYYSPWSKAKTVTTKK